MGEHLVRRFLRHEVASVDGDASHVHRPFVPPAVWSYRLSTGPSWLQSASTGQETCSCRGPARRDVHRARLAHRRSASASQSSLIQLS